MEKVPFRRQRETIDLLLQEKIITHPMLDQAKTEAASTGMTVEKALEKLGFVTAEDIVKARAHALDIPYIDLTDYIVDPQTVKLIPEEIARKCKAIPLFRINNSLTVGMSEPQDIMAIDQMRRVSLMEIIDPVMVSEKGLQRILDTIYAQSKLESMVKSIDPEKLNEEKNKLTEATEESPIIKLVNIIIEQAVRDHASDIHIEPEEYEVRVRCRVDGILRQQTVFPKKLQEAVNSRIKIMAKVDIAENRKPQDGRSRIEVDKRLVDLRISTFPTVHGENVVIRILDRSAILLGLKDVGFHEKDLEIFQKLIHRPNGIILVTGPTGSGKTSTLYAALTTISSMEKNIITIEDPVEFELQLIRQTQINPKAGITFANGLRSILRQDPDVIMVGEIRDKETADVAVQAALTGHLVMATLHTNDAPSALTRLMDMGVEPFLVASSTIGVLAQRLVRLICEKCKEKYSPEASVLKDMGLPEGTEIFRGKGCSHCNGSGLKGRTGIFEGMVINDDLRRLVECKSSADVIKQKAVELGMITLRQNGLKKVQLGLITPEEVLRVTEVEA